MGEPTIEAMRATIRALLAQLDGIPVKHPQQRNERDVALWLIADGKHRTGRGESGVDLPQTVDGKGGT